MDISWVAERTNYWDAIAVSSYGLMFTLFESLLVWFVLILLGFLLPKKWTISKRIVLLGMFVAVAILWAIFGQLYFLLEWSLPTGVIQFLASQSHPLRILYASTFFFVTLTVLLAGYLAISSSRLQESYILLIDRLSTLMWFYLILDVVSIFIVLSRNIG